MYYFFMPKLNKLIISYHIGKYTKSENAFIGNRRYSTEGLRQNCRIKGK